MNSHSQCDMSMGGNLINSIIYMFQSLEEADTQLPMHGTNFIVRMMLGKPL